MTRETTRQIRNELRANESVSQTHDRNLTCPFCGERKLSWNALGVSMNRPACEHLVLYLTNFSARQHTDSEVTEVSVENGVPLASNLSDTATVVFDTSPEERRTADTEPWVAVYTETGTVSNTDANDQATLPTA